MSAYNLHRSPAVDELPLFAKPAPNLAEGLRRKEEGRNRAASRDTTLMAVVRDHLRELGADGRVVTIDDARDWMDANGLTAPSKYWFGPIFQHSEWDCVRLVPSRRPEKHGHANRAWRLKGA